MSYRSWMIMEGIPAEVIQKDDPALEKAIRRWQVRHGPDRMKHRGDIYEAHASEILSAMLQGAKQPNAEFVPLESPNSIGVSAWLARHPEFVNKQRRLAELLPNVELARQRARLQRQASVQDRRPSPPQSVGSDTQAPGYIAFIHRLRRSQAVQASRLSSATEAHKLLRAMSLPLQLQLLRATSREDVQPRYQKAWEVLHSRT